MKGRLWAIALALAASGCATTGAGIGVKDQPPPSLEVAINELQAVEGCGENWRLDPTNDLVAKGGVIEQCPAVGPEVLLQAGFEGACRSIFDLTANGRIENLETRCSAVSADAPGAYENEWRTFAEALFAASARRSLEALRIDMNALDPTAPRSSLSNVTYFVFDGREDPSLIPPPFERTAAE